MSSAYLAAKLALAAVVLPRLAGPDAPPQGGDIKPGWVALVIVLALCVATTLLWLSMRRHLGKIRFDETAETGDAAPGDTGTTGDRGEERDTDR